MLLILRRESEADCIILVLELYMEVGLDYLELQRLEAETRSSVDVECKFLLRTKCMDC